VSLPEPRARLVFGRNYVETLVLTLIQHELSNPDTGDLVVAKLEEELCSLAMVNPQLEVHYREAITRLMDEMYPELPKPNLRGCFQLEAVKRWLRTQKRYILEAEKDILRVQDVEKYIKAIAHKIVKTAVLGTLYKTGILTART